MIIPVILTSVQLEKTSFQSLHIHLLFFRIGYEDWRTKFIHQYPILGHAGSSAVPVGKWMDSNKLVMKKDRPNERVFNVFHLMKKMVLIMSFFIAMPDSKGMVCCISEVKMD